MSGRIGDRTPTGVRSKPIKGKRALATLRRPFSFWIGASKETGTVVCIAALSCRWFHHGWRI